MKILHCPTDTGGNAWGISRAERELGLRSDVAVFRSSYLSYPSDIDFQFKRILSPGRELRRWGFLYSAIKEYDIFHFNFAKSILDYPYLFLNYLDLPIIKKYGKKIFFTLHGSDVRLSNMPNSFKKSAFPDFIRKVRIKKISHYADKIYALNPDLIHHCPKAEFLSYASVDLKEWVPGTAKRDKGEVINVYHFPTNRDTKGTKNITEAVGRLKGEGFPIKFFLVENVPNCSVREIYRSGEVDLVIDQLLIGWYGGVAVEAMACGVPVISYINEEDTRFIPEKMREELPIINADEYSIYKILKEWVTTRRSELPERGGLGRSYAERWHDPIKIANRLKKDYEA